MSIVTLDDRDGSISYAPSGNWGQMGVKEENDGTTSYTTKAGSTITIPFTGTQISIFGTISPNGTGDAPSSTYSVDGSAPQSFNGAQLPAVQFRQLFFRSSQLSPSSHTLIITSTSSSAYFWFDYAEVVSFPPQISSTQSSTSITPLTTSTSSSSSSSSSSSTTSTSTTSSPGSSFTSSTSSSRSQSTLASQSSSTPNVQNTSLTSDSSSPLITNQSNSPNDSNAAVESRSSKSSTGVIIGAVIGSLALIILVLFLIWFLRRRQRRTGALATLPPGQAPTSDRQYHVVPFTDEPSMHATNVTNMSYATAGSASHLAAERNWSPQHGHTATVSSTSDLYSGSSGQLYNNSPGNVHTTAATVPSAGSYSSKSQIMQASKALTPDPFINPLPIYQA